MVAGLLALAGAAGTPCLAQQIAPFRLTGVEGYATMRYLRDDYVTEQPVSGGGAGGRSRQGISDMREEIFLMTHSYVYHPNLLSLDIGGGPILQQGRAFSDTGETKSNAGLYNFTGRASMLRDKPYQGSLFLEHLNPTITVAPGQAMTQENSRYGFDFSLLAPVTPVPMYVEATHSHSKGRGADRVVDDQVDRVNFRASRSFGGLGSTQLQFQSTQQTSQSGSPNLPIQGSNSNNQGLNLDTRLQFGGARQYDLTNLITLNSQSYALTGSSLIPDRKDERVLLDLRGRHSKELQSFGFYNYTASQQGDLHTAINSAAAGLNYAPRPEVMATLGAHADQSRTTQLATNSHGADGSLRYQRALPLGTGQVSYTLRVDQRDQQALATQTRIIGERLTLSGTLFVALAQQHVTAGSVVVSNVTRTQTFVEGLDYTLSVLGAQTRVQRVVAGAIVDPQDVLVDYAYDVGGSFAYTQADQTFNAIWSLSSYGSAYYRYFDSAPRLTSGTPSFPLNTVKSSVYGARADVPLRLRLETSIGGSFEYENRRETIAPYRRESEDAYVQMEEPILGSGNIRASTRRTRVNYDNFSLQNVNLTGSDLRYVSRHWLGTELTANVGVENDTGAAVPRRRLIESVKAQWRYRKASLTFDFGRTLETQGDFKRTRTLVQLVARRDF
jgi:hypothetical protein